MKEQIIKMLKQHVSYTEIMNRVGCSRSTVSRYAKLLGKSKRRTDSKYDWDNIQDFYNTHSYSETLEEFNLPQSSWLQAVKRGDLVSRGRENNIQNLNEILIENSTYTYTTDLKHKLLTNKLLTHKCAICGQEPWHNGQELVLQLDHINGVKNDNRIENLRLLCPNCHTQTPTWGRKRRN